MLLEVDDVTFRHEPGQPQVKNVSFALREGETFGVLGANECGKTTLAQLLMGNLTPESGSIKVFGFPPAGRRFHTPRWPYVVHTLLAVCCAATAAAAVLDPLGWPLLLASMNETGVWALPLLLVLLEVTHVVHAVASKRSNRHARTDSGRAPASMLAVGVAYMSSEHDGGQKLKANQTVEDAIAQDMPREWSREERRREVRAALEASGFQMMADTGTPVGNAEQYLNDGLTCGELSGGQRHLVYLLSVLASRPRVLICDECLCSLDIDRQSSMLKLLQRLQLKFGLAIVFLTVDLTSFSLMCANEAAFMKNGRFIEGGQAHDMVERPQRKDTLVYITQCTENEDRSHGKNLRNAFQKGKSVFSL